jgi:hypothetical protein
MRTMQTEQNRTDEADPLHRPPPNGALARQALSLVAVALLGLAGAGASYVLLRALPADGNALDNPDEGPRPQIKFAGWGQPDLAIVVSGQLHGYLFPCGCSPVQNGGLVRRWTFVESLKAKGWPVAAVDLGELATTSGLHHQRQLKLEATMRALDLMGYGAVGLGKNEMAMPLTDALVAYSGNNPSPRPVASSLKKTDLYHALNVRPYAVLDSGAGTPRLGVLSMTGPNLEDHFKGDRDMQFLNNKDDVLPKIAKAFAAEKVELAILLHHDYPLGTQLQVEKSRRDMAEKVAKFWESERKKNSKVPPLALLMVLAEEPEPPSVLFPVPGTPTHILEIGKKGKYVGVVGVYRKGGVATLKYELVLMDPSLDPKAGQANPILGVLEEYAKQVKADRDLLDKFPRVAHLIQLDNDVLKTYGGSYFVGSDTCKQCHKKEHAIWKETHHAKAFQTLVAAAKPSLRQFDPECVICHTVGFKHPDGYNDLTRHVAQDLLKQKAKPGDVAAALAKHNEKLENVGCESCHGPGSAHALGNPNDPKLHELMNPFRAGKAEEDAIDTMKKAQNAVARQKAEQTAKLWFNRRMDRLDQFCQKCHDEENDNRWNRVPFLEKWVGGGIVHNSPGNIGNQWLPAKAPAKKDAAHP